MRSKVPSTCPWQQMVSSPLRRCAEFAHALATEQQIALQIVDYFREMSFGDWEGKTIADLEAEQPRQLDAYFRDPLNALPPKAEPILGVQQRVITAWTQLLADYEGKHVLLVAHGGVIRLLLCHILGMPLNYMWRIEVPYASISRVCVFRDKSFETTTPVLIFHDGVLP